LVSTILFPSKILVSMVINLKSSSGTLRILKALMENPFEGLAAVASLLTENPWILLQLYLCLNSL